ncbi:MAG: tetratricopeptide repeat protein, partial [Anaerolineae bacterium]
LRGDPDRARRCATEGWGYLRCARHDEEMAPWFRDRATIILARTHALWGEWHQAHRYATQALTHNTARGDTYGATDAHVTLAQACHGLGRYPEARAHAEKALTQAESAGDLRLQGKALYVLTRAYVDGAQPARAEPLVVDLLAIAEQTGDLEAYARGQLLRAQLLHRAGALDAAEAILGPLLAKARAVGVPSYIVMALRQLAETRAAAGDFAGARASADEAQALAHRCRMRHELSYLAQLRARLGEANG